MALCTLYTLDSSPRHRTSRAHALLSAQRTVDTETLPSPLWLYFGGGNHYPSASPQSCGFRSTLTILDPHAHTRISPQSPPEAGPRGQRRADRIFCGYTHLKFCQIRLSGKSSRTFRHAELSRSRSSAWPGCCFAAERFSTWLGAVRSSISTSCQLCRAPAGRRTSQPAALSNAASPQPIRRMLSDSKTGTTPVRA